MKQVLRFCVFCVLTILASSWVYAIQPMEQGRRLGSGDHLLSLKVGNRERRYIVHVPMSYDDGRPTPIVVMFHGGGSTAKDAIAETGWTEKADHVGFLVAFPEGMSPDPSKPSNFRKNPQFWNDASKRFLIEKIDIDDGAFTRELIDDLTARFNIDAKRIFLTGFSNGSSLTYRLGVELSDRVAAIAPVASSGLRLDDPLTLQRPVSLIAIHGMADRINPFGGGDVKGLGRSDIDQRPPIKDSVERWARMLACSDKPEILLNKDGVRALRYGLGRRGSEVVLYTIEDTGHTWPGGISLLPQWLVGKTTNKIKATDVIWEFFAKHPMPE
jgi:polyhydroxybutyrate depolymerase